MKTQTIFEYRDYKKYLLGYIKSRPQNGHGEKSRIAAAIRCHNAYLSQVLSGGADLSLEQAHALAQYLGLSADETDYLHLLVQLARAGTDDLRKHLHRKLDELDQRRLNLKTRLQHKKTLSKEDQATYLSAWYYSVIHLMISTLKDFRTREAIEAALDLPPKTIRIAFQFLEESGMIKREGNEYSAELVDIFLSAEDPMIVPHHTHWRMQALRSLENRLPEDLHYSSAVTVSESDFKAIREILVQTIEKTRETIAKTKPEKVGIITLDWFSLLR